MNEIDELRADKERLETIDIVFDSAPSNEGGRFIECEDGDGKSLRVGEWVHRPDGYWVLRLSVAIDKARESSEDT